MALATDWMRGLVLADTAASMPPTVSLSELCCKYVQLLGIMLRMSPGELPREVPKPWGSELWYAHTDRYAGKILRIDKGHRLSVQYHLHKDETSYLLEGRLIVSQGIGGGEMLRQAVERGAVWRNRPQIVHTIEALEDSVILEVSTPELDDVVRLDDRYGRLPDGQHEPHQ
jgi:quercetin dioxygenase-like cupin family protein